MLVFRGKNETFVLTAQQNPVEYDLARAVTVDGVLAIGAPPGRLLMHSAIISRFS